MTHLPRSLAVTAALLAMTAGARAAEQNLAATAEKVLSEGTITFRGKAICLDEAGAESRDPELCDRPDSGARFALLTPDGAMVSFLPGDPQAEMMIDPRVRERTLQVVGWPRESGEIEILHVRSIRNGQLFDIHYRCDVCNITATAPGPCWCCRKDFELRETPLRNGPGDQAFTLIGAPSEPDDRP